MEHMLSTIDRDVPSAAIRDIKDSHILMHSRPSMRQACIPAIIGSLLATVYNPNVIGDEYAKLVAQAELECVVSRRGQGREKGWELGGRGGCLRGAELMVVANECGMRALDRPWCRT